MVPDLLCHIYLVMINFKFSDLIMKSCQKKQESLNRQDAMDTKFKTRSRDIVQNPVSVLDKAAFSLAVTRQMKKNPVFLGDLRVLSESSNGRLIVFWVAGVSRVRYSFDNYPLSLLAQAGHPESNRGGN